MTKHLLLTGATGLVGAYLLRDFLARETPLAVLVRPARGWTPAQRIEYLMDRWERIAGASLPRPVVLCGDILSPGLGLTASERAWVRDSVGGVFHNAASLEFSAQDRGSEPWRSNLDGTKNVLAFCREHGLRKFFHVSTAYVAGKRTGRILESELDVGQAFGNPYEESKLLAEKEVRAASFLDSAAFLRPAIIVGDSQTAYTSTFHGFYAPLKAAASLVALTASTEVKASQVMPMFGLTGGEGKNFVPVEWVSALMTRVALDPALHGGTYHLVPLRRTPLALMAEVIERTVRERLAARIRAKRCTPAPVDLDRFGAQLGEMLEVYRPYWRDDPEFDATNTLRIAADLPCPELDEACLERLCRYAIDANFGFPRPRAAPIPLDLRSLLAEWVEPAAATNAAPHDHSGNGAKNGASPRSIGLSVTGAGGGPWTLRCLGDRVVEVRPGLEAGPQIQLSTPTLFSLPQEGPEAAARAIRSGRVRLSGPEADRASLADWVERLTASVARRILDGAAVAAARPT